MKNEKDYQKHREYMRVYQNRWLQNRRKQWLQENGPCKKCGTWENLEIDHIDPNQKKYEVSSLWSRKEEIREKELAKCQVLCKAHHRQKTSEENRLAGHGTAKRYKHKRCKCASCLSAKKRAQLTTKKS